MLELVPVALLWGVGGGSELLLRGEGNRLRCSWSTPAPSKGVPGDVTGLWLLQEGDRLYLVRVRLLTAGRCPSR